MKRWMLRGLALALALLMPVAPALAISAQRAEELVKQADKKAEKARQFWTFPDGDGAWVFYGAGWNKDNALFEGAFWYVDESQAVQLGDYTKNVLHWDLLNSDPAIFTSVTRYDGVNHLHAALLLNGTPVEISELNGLVDLYGDNGVIYGADRRSYDQYIFLYPRGDEFVEIAAAPIDEAEARAIEGVGAILDELTDGEWYQGEDVRIEDFLYRPAAPGAADLTYGAPHGSIAVNVSWNGAPYHAYIFLDGAGGAYADRGWESEIALFDGEALARYDIGFEVVETTPAA